MEAKTCEHGNVIDPPGLNCLHCMAAEQKAARRIAPSALTAAARINGQFRCDCGCLTFMVGIAASEHNDNNFIRVMECTGCGRQHLIVHQSNAQIEPSIAGALRRALT